MHPDTRPLAGLYVLTDTPSEPATLLPRVAAVLRGGANVIQYRDKTGDPAQRRAEAEAIRALCQRHGAIFIVNDDPALAAEVGADGVHLGRSDMSLAEARRIVGAKAIIGISCYDSLDRARSVAAEGANYVAFGSIYPSATKPDAVPAPLTLLTQATRQLAVPLVAIGGISAGNAAPVIAAGADALAVISSVFLAADPEAEARRLATLFPT
jgi:thiamine-phosphate pyrophosphorylase